MFLLIEQQEHIDFQDKNLFLKHVERVALNKFIHQLHNCAIKEGMLNRLVHIMATDIH